MTQSKNPYGVSYTKRDLCYLLRNANVDLHCPGAVKPMHTNTLAKKLKVLLPETGYTWEQIKKLRYLPAQLCDIIRENL